jgi:hypothetical protein
VKRPGGVCEAAFPADASVKCQEPEGHVGAHTHLGDSTDYVWWDDASVQVVR